MAFISNSMIGKVYTLARDVVLIKGTILKGSKVTITNVSQRGYDFIDNESKEKCIEVSSIWDGKKVFEEIDE
jgi:protein involved in ribonucleotide reduction